MGKLKKVFILLSIVGLAFGYSMASFSVMPQKAEAAKTSLQNVSTTESDSEADTEEPVSDQDPDAKVASCIPAVAVGAIYFGNPSGFFNTATTISASWEGLFSSSTPIIKYKYRLKKVSSPTEIIIPWTETTETNFTKTLLTPLEEGQTYKVIVKAKNGPKCWSEKVRSSGQTLDLTGPSAVIDLNLAHDVLNNPIVNLNWSVSTDNLSGVARYDIYRSMSSSPFFYIGSRQVGDVLSFPDTVLADNQIIEYKVIVFDEVNNQSADSNIVSTYVDDIAPGAPSISYWIGGKNIVIFFPAVSGASSYEIYRSGALIYSGPEIKYTDTNTVRGETYSYTVYALDNAGNKSPASNTLEIYIPKPKVSSVATAGEVQGTSTVTPGQTEQVSPSPSPTPSGQVEGTESPKPEETQEEAKTNWSLIIAIIIAAAIVVAGVLYWWYAREEDEEDEI